MAVCRIAAVPQVCGLRQDVGGELFEGRSMTRGEGRIATADRNPDGAAAGR